MSRGRNILKDGTFFGFIQAARGRLPLLLVLIEINDVIIYKIGTYYRTLKCLTKSKK